MALLFMEGFEVDGGDSVALGRKYDLTAAASSTDTGRLHGTSFAVASGARLRTRSFGSPTATCVIGFGYKDETVGDSAQGLEIRLLNGVNEQLNLVSVTVSATTFRLDLYRGAVLLDSSASYSTLNWHYFELKVLVDPTVGTYELRHNESVDFSGTGANTASSGSANWDVIDIENTASDTGARLDDIYILDGTGGSLDDFLGDSVVEGRLPSGDGATTDWTPSAGVDHWDLLDDATDGTLVSSNNASDLDYLTFDSLSFITGTIHGVMGMAAISLDVLGTRTARLNALSVAATTNGATQTISSTSYTTFYEVFEDDPNTATAWTIAGVNAASFGFELVS